MRFEHIYNTSGRNLLFFISRLMNSSWTKPHDLAQHNENRYLALTGVRLDQFRVSNYSF